MKISRKNILTVFCLGVFFLNACAGNENAGSSTQSNQPTADSGKENNAPVVKDDADELGKIVNLPFAPEDATWREDAAAAPNRKKMTAVVKFSAEDAANIVRQAESLKPAVNSAIDAETWFPAELIAQSQLSGDETLKGATFAADNFLRPPYNQGKITRISETNYFVLELTAP
ncbi:MAG TPA: hypothetical protein VNI84_14005 [Pyrinomonadaceae bacterium]|nr:hypothetical protein [Pyrinomonadaceae bacterium]